MKLLFFTTLVLICHVSSGNYHFVYHFLNLVIGTVDHITKILLSPYYATPQIEEGEKFDFILVGAGASGSVLANRLSENKTWNILLLEAGEAPNYIFDIPAFAGGAHFSQYNWQYKTEKQNDFGLGLQDQILEWPRGKGLGGSSLINFMIAMRGNPADYDHWAALGNHGWSYKDMLPYFRKLETSHILHNDKGYHGHHGYLDRTYPPYKTKAMEIFLKAAKELNIPHVDYNGKHQLGVSQIQATLREGLRCSTEKAYLRPIRKRKNLKILTKSHVTKILIDKKSKKAYGIEYYHKNNYHTVQATKEVILSAGAFHSPQLLMLSGIGPNKDLTNLGIETLVDLPVGKKLYDHLPFLGLLFEVNQKLTDTLYDYFKPQSFFKLFLKANGPLTKLGGAVEAVNFIKTNVTKTNSSQPDMELLFIGDSFTTDHGIFLKTAFRVSDQSYKKFFKPYEKKHTFQIFPTLFHPKSHGNLTLKSTNPFDPPLLFGNYLTDTNREDIKNFVAAIRNVQQLIKTKAWQKYETRLSKTPIPGCEHLDFDSDPYWECGVRHLTATFHHQTSTCKMGPKNDPEAIVNHKLQVNGIDSLRIVDLSIVPVTLSGHTYVPAVAIAERAADLIKKDWKHK